MPPTKYAPSRPPIHPWKGFAAQVDPSLRSGAAKLPQIYYGPKELGLRFTDNLAGGPETFVNANPQLFHTGTTSRDEGYFYWAELKLLGPEGPEGGWYYQSGHANPNAAVIDFRVVRGGGLPDLAIRIQSQYRHLGGGAEKQATDAEQVYQIDSVNQFQVVDVWSEWYMGDKSGQTVLAVARTANEGDPFSYSPVIE